MMKGDKTNKPAIPTDSNIFLSEDEVKLSAYYIGVNNYLKLRDLGKIFNFNIVWDEQTKTILINTNLPAI